MRTRKIEQLVREHPYLVDVHYKMSIKQAKELQEKEGYPDFEEMLEKAVRKSFLRPGVQKVVDSILNKKQRECASKTRNYRIRRWAIACSVALLIAGYLAFTPSGRAFAQTIAKVGLQILGDEIQLENAAADSPEVFLPIQQTFQKYDSHQEFMEDTGREAIWLDAKDFVLVGLTAYDYQIDFSLISEYEATTGIGVRIHQVWDFSELYGSKNSDEEFFEISAPNGVVFHCFEDYTGEVSGVASWKDSSIFLYIDAEVDVETVINNIHFR